MQGEGRKMTVRIHDTHRMPKVDTPTALPSWLRISTSLILHAMHLVLLRV